MADHYPDLPEELQRLFPVASISIPEEIREYIRDAWPVIRPRHRQEIVVKCRRKSDLLQRVLTVVNATTMALFDSRPSSSRKLSI